MAKCNCEICTRHREEREAIEKKDVPKLIEFVNQLESDLMHAQMDTEYYEVVMHGNWPRSVEILERALENAKEIRTKA